MDPAVFISLLALTVAVLGFWWQVVQAQEATRRAEANERRSEEAHALALKAVSAEFALLRTELAVPSDGVATLTARIVNEGGGTARNLSGFPAYPDGGAIILATHVKPRVEAGSVFELTWPLVGAAGDYFIWSPGQARHPPVPFLIRLRYADDRGQRLQTLGEGSLPYGEPQPSGSASQA